MLLKPIMQIYNNQYTVETIQKFQIQDHTNNKDIDKIINAVKCELERKKFYNTGHVSISINKSIEYTGNDKDIIQLDIHDTYTMLYLSHIKIKKFKLV